MTSNIPAFDYLNKSAFPLLAESHMHCAKFDHLLSITDKMTLLEAMIHCNISTDFAYNEKLS